jgi:ankyrin repeat protein
MQEAIEALAAAGAALNAADELGGDTALHLAALWGHTEALRALLRLGANTAVTDVLGNTPLHHCADSGHGPVRAPPSTTERPQTHTAFV